MSATIESLFGLDLFFFIVVMIVALAGFIVSSTFGLGGAIVLIPVLAQRMPAAHAVALSAPIMLFNNVLKCIAFRQAIDKRAVFLVSALALPAAFVGAWFAAKLDDKYILLGIAALIVLTIGVERGLDRKMKVSDRALFFWGAFTGAVSGLCGAAGPPTAIGLRGYGLDREGFVGTVALFAVLLQIVKMPAYVGTGVLPLERWPLAVVLSVAALIGVAVAPPLLKRIPQKAFGIVLDVVLALSAMYIVYDVWRR